MSILIVYSSKFRFVISSKGGLVTAKKSKILWLEHHRGDGYLSDMMKGPFQKHRYQILCRYFRKFLEAILDSMELALFRGA